MGFHIGEGQRVELRYSGGEPEAVKIAIHNLAQDLGKVMPGVETVLREEPGHGEAAREACGGEKHTSVIIIGTLAKQDTSGQNPACESGAGTACAVESASSWQDAGERSGRRPIREDMERVIRRSLMTDEKGLLRKEAYQLQVRDGTLYIGGTDRRGTIYGIYTFCEWMGVSPWYFFADVPVRKREELTLEEGYCLTDWPSVEYRGIFINDEEELEAWVQNRMGEPTIGVKTYEKIFELLLRLKANYIWPAMHVNSFNLVPENGALADRCGIVVGTSHCDMLMRSNNREWKPWIQKKGYADVVYDYSVEGRNRDILQEYWRESVEQNREFEVCYTLGMRGIHDSGFETKGLEGGTEEEIRAAKIQLLGKIIADQREILQNTLGRETMMTFIPYKEVLELYDSGLEIPEDMTLVWANDNYGYIRRYPSEKEKGRKGGNGIYYHNSYWAPPSMSYVFLCSIPLAHTRNELQKAWDEGIRKLWVLNSGAMKPLEQEITFFLRLAWEIGKPGALTEDVEAFVEDWIDRTFTGGIGKQVSALLNDFSQITNVRKVENMDYDAFSQTAYGDEGALRLQRYEELFTRGNALYRELPGEERDAFFELVLMRIQAAYFTNLAYYYGDRSTLMYRRGNRQGARLYTEKSREAEDARRRLLHYYNHMLCGGKWNGILNPEGFPPPRAAMMPACTPPLWREDGEQEGKIGSLSAGRHVPGENGGERREQADGGSPMEVYLWNDGRELCFATPGEKWFEIGNLGDGAFEVQIDAPEWAGLSRERAVVRAEERILVNIEDVSENREGEIIVENITDGATRIIPIRIRKTEPAGAHSGRHPAEETSGSGKAYAAEGKGNVCAASENGNVYAIGEDDGTADARNEYAFNACALEEDGLVTLEAQQALSGLGRNSDFRIIPRLGRMQGSLVQARGRGDAEAGEWKGQGECAADRQQAISLCYRFATRSKGAFLLEIHRFPSLNSAGRIRIGVSLDEGPVQIVESFSNDEWRGNWKENVLNNVDRLYLQLPMAEPGCHRLSLWAVDPYFAFSRLVIYTEPRKENSLAGIRGAQPLPSDRDLLKWCDSFYGKYELPPRPVYYAAVQDSQDTLTVNCKAVQPERYGETVEPDWYRDRGNRMFEENNGEIRIDAAAALAESEYAWTQEPGEPTAAQRSPREPGEPTAAQRSPREPGEPTAAQRSPREPGETTAAQRSPREPGETTAAQPGLWRHCAGESFGRSGLALYIRTPKLCWQEQDAPSLNYRFTCGGGVYTLWMLSKFNVREEGVFSVGFDGERIPRERIYAGGSLWRYEAEQIYRWVPVTQAELALGEHLLQVYALSSGMRFDRFYLTKGQELPPMDTEWPD